MNIEIANRLQQMRKRNNLSQEELAMKMGVTRQAVSKWERAESAPDMENLILLSKLYGVTIDELINAAPIPEQASGVSLRKDDYGYAEEPIREKIPENYTEEEVYPNASVKTENSIPQGSPFGADLGEEDNRHEDFAKTMERAGRAVGDVINAAGQKIGETIKKSDGKIPDDWEIKLEKGMEKLENGFERFGEKFEKGFEKFENAMERAGVEAQRKMDVKAEKHAKNAEKKPMTLFDKLFPLTITFLFLCTIPLNLAHPGWTLFLLIPLHYTTKEAIQKHNIMIFCYPVFCALIYFFIGGFFEVFMSGVSDNWYGFAWLIFLTIPLYYTIFPAIKKRNPLIFCYPVLCVLVWLGVGLFLDNLCITNFSSWWLSWMWIPIFGTIPFYYIVFSHLRGKKKA